MACCGLDKDKPLYVVAPVLAALLLGAAAGAVAAALLSPFSRRARRATKAILLFAAAAVREVRDRVLKKSYLLSPRLRCVIAGKVMRVSPRLGGLLYKRLGTVILLGLLAAAIVCWTVLHGSVR